jgi:hypothetical protein
MTKKRPASIYLLVGLWTLLLAVVQVFMISSVSGHYLNSHLKDFWGFFPENVRTIMWVYSAVSAFTIIGLWTGKKWGRTLSFILSLFIIFAVGQYLLAVLATTDPDKLTGWFRFFNYVEFLIISPFFLLFYLTLRPEIAVFCGFYPQESLIR